MSFMPGLIESQPIYVPPIDRGIPVVSAPYWRVRMPWSNDNAYVLNEIEMRATEGGPDQCSGGTPSAYAASATVANLFDNNPLGASWTASSTNTYLGWIQYQFAAPVEVVEIAITCENSPQYTPRVVALDCSQEGVNWTMWAHWDGLTPWASRETKILNAANRSVIPAGASPLWRLRITANNGYSNLELTEIEYRDTPGGPSVPTIESIAQTGFQASGSSWTNSSLYDGDGSTASYAAISASNLPAWNGVRFPANHAFAQAAIRNRNRSGAPKEFTFERSRDWGLTWEVVHMGTMHIDWDPNQETRLFDLMQPASSGIRGDWYIDMGRIAAGWTVSDLASAGINVSGGDNDAGFLLSNKPLGTIPRYFEFRIDARGAGSNAGYVGIVEAAQRIYFQSFHFAERPSSYGYRESGEIRVNGSITGPTGLPTYGVGDIVMVAYNRTANTLQFGKNGAWQSTVHTLAAGTHYPAFSLRDQGDMTTLIGNAADLTYAPPPGFSDLAA